MNYSVLKLVRENLKITGLGDRAETLHTDAFKFLQLYSSESQALSKGQEREYDIIYVAPPQYHEMAARALHLLDRSWLVPDTGMVIVQIHPKERSVVAAVPLTHLILTDERRYGSTLLLFYEADAGRGE
jgi:16S rRNA (guanine966-N2)-methyltransferase